MHRRAFRKQIEFTKITASLLSCEVNGGDGDDEDEEEDDEDEEDEEEEHPKKDDEDEDEEEDEPIWTSEDSRIRR